MKKKIEIITFLETEMFKKISQLVSLYFLELKGTDEQKKSAEAMAFMEAIFSGGEKLNDAFSKDKSFASKNKSLFNEIYEYNNDIKFIKEIK